jgi:antitoxin (DNA-binding transcriptional repressor) of toxin-antitoxin stability system
MRIPVTQFKARCTALLRDLSAGSDPIEVTRKGKVVAIVTPPEPPLTRNPVVGCLKGTVTYLPGWDESLGEEVWEACQ